jgi:predicted Zn finger-like uncharacterized protein
MIITCPNCEKKFQIDPALVPEKGRDLQCGSCNHAWFYEPENQSEAPLPLNENTFVNKEKTKIETEDQNIEISKKTKKEKKNKSRIKKEISKEIPKIIEKPTNSGSKLFSYLIVFIISFVALVILLDTLKTPLINVFPGLEIILFNLFETLKDLKLFIIDLT